MFKNVAIVGNGPSEINSNNGSLIDSFDKVIRMNNFEINDMFINDYGSKVDHWCTNMNASVGTKYREDNFEYVFVPFPAHILNRHPESKKIYDKYRGITLCIPQSYYNELIALAAKLSGKRIQPSTGLGMLFWIWKENKKLDKEQIFGFSFFEDLHKEIDNWHHYFDDSIPWESGYVVNHNGIAEKKVYEYLVTHNG